MVARAHIRNTTTTGRATVLSQLLRLSLLPSLQRRNDNRKQKLEHLFPPPSDFKLAHEEDRHTSKTESHCSVQHWSYHPSTGIRVVTLGLRRSARKWSYGCGIVRGRGSPRRRRRKGNRRPRGVDRQFDFKDGRECNGWGYGVLCPDNDHDERHMGGG